MAKQQYRHHRVAKKEIYPETNCFEPYLDYLSENPIVFWGLIFILLKIIKHLICPHR